MAVPSQKPTRGGVLPFRRGGTAGAARIGVQPGTVDSESEGQSDPARFREVVGPHLNAAYSLARYLAHDPAVAEDITQEAMLSAFRAFASLRGEAKPWLLAIVRNAYFDWRRKSRGWETITGPGGVSDQAAMERATDPDQETAETGLIRQGDVAALRAAIEAIPEPFREALVLRDLEELSYRQVAEITGAPMGTVMSRLARARRMLGERLGVMEAVR